MARAALRDPDWRMAINWRTLQEEKDGKGGSETVTFAPTSARYVRFDGLASPMKMRQMTVR